VRRDDWARSQALPYTDPYRLKVPGPGTYGEKQPLHFTPRGEREKRKVYGLHHPSQIMAMNDVSGPMHAFNSTDIRPCNKRMEHDTPAPGMYQNDGTLEYTIASRVKERAQVGKKGAFGSTTDRFFRSPLGAKKQVDAGQYEAATYGKHEEAPKSMFTSTSNRFKGTHGAADPPGMVKVDKHVTPGPQAYDVDKEVNYRSPYRQPRSEHLSFGSGKNRFDGREVFHGHKLNANPGPGEYTAREMARRKQRVGKSLRFQRKVGDYAKLGCTTESVGPGTYDYEGGMLKRSFNVTTEQRVPV